MRCLKLLILALLLAIVPACGTPKSTTEEKNKEVVEEMVEIINSRDYDRLGEVIADGIVRHSAATPDVSVKSLEDMKAFLKKDNQSVPDSVITIERLIAENDIVAGRFTYEGTQKGPMGPFPASDKPVKGPFISFLRLENGKVAEMWVEWDNLSMLMQLGHFPPKPENDEEDLAEKNAK